MNFWIDCYRFFFGFGWFWAPKRRPTGGQNGAPEAILAHLGLILASSWLILGSSWLILASSYFTASWGRLSVPLSQRIAAAAQQDFAAAGVKAPLGVARFASIGATGRLKNNMRKDLFKHKLAPLVMRDALCSIRLWIKSRALRLHLLTLLYSFAWQTNQQILASFDGKMIVSLCADAWMHQHTETLFSNDAAYD